MQQLQNDCLDKPSWQNANDDPNRKTEVTDRRTHGRRISRISKRQEYSTPDSSPETDSRESMMKGQKDLQLLRRLPEGI